MSFHAYLFFAGDCRAAFTRYQEVFGGDLEVMTMADAPEGEGMPGASPDTVLHAALTVGDGLLMGSDDPTSDEVGPVRGVMVSYTAADADEVRRVFEALSEGGQVTQEPIETFFSPAFGMCTDRFGVAWMVSAEPAEEG